MRLFSHAIMPLAGLLLIACNPVYSQVPVRLGLDVGINLANQSISRDVGPQSYRSGLIIGGVAEICISDLLSIQAEPAYIQEGTVLTGGIRSMNGTFPEEETFKLAYFEIPLLLKAKFGTADFKPVFFVGPNVGFLLSAIYQTKNYDVQGLGTLDGLDIKDRYKSVNVSLDAGAGAEYRISNGLSLTGSVRYSFGLKDINSWSDDTIKTNGIQVIFGTLFDL